MRTAEQAILIVENDDPSRALYIRELKQAFQVFTCANEHDALAIVRSVALSAVVLEPALEDGRGWELLVKLREELANQDVPIVLCSTLDERRLGLKLGAAMYLIKPVLPLQLLEVLRQCISSNKLRGVPNLDSPLPTVPAADPDMPL